MKNLSQKSLDAFAYNIQKLVLDGKIDPISDADELIAYGINSQYIEYWKKIYFNPNDIPCLDCGCFCRQVCREDWLFFDKQYNTLKENLT